MSPAGRTKTVEVPYGVRLATDWAWRLILLAAFVYLLLRLLSIFEVIVVPFLLAMLLVALTRPLTDLLARRPAARACPRLLTVLIVIAIVVGLVTLVGTQIASGFPDLENQTSSGLTEVQHWLATGPLHITTDQLAALRRPVAELAQLPHRHADQRRLLGGRHGQRRPGRDLHHALLDLLHAGPGRCDLGLDPEGPAGRRPGADGRRRPPRLGDPDVVHPGHGAGGGDRRDGDRRRGRDPGRAARRAAGGAGLPRLPSSRWSAPWCPASSPCWSRWSPTAWSRR